MSDHHHRIDTHHNSPAFVGIWFGAVLRGDNEPIDIGERNNIQGGAMLHTDPGFPLTIGPE